MDDISLYTPNNKPTDPDRKEIVGFLFDQLDEYGDAQKEIAECMKFALGEGEKALGGMVLVARSVKDEIVGATIVNETGMSGYIPEHILVYIAVHQSTRGKGIGEKMVRTVINSVEGNIALHVEPQNPAVKLYEKLGFTNKYIEMRYEASK